MCQFWAACPRFAGAAHASAAFVGVASRVRGRTAHELLCQSTVQFLDRLISQGKEEGEEGMLMKRTSTVNGLPSSNAGVRWGSIRLVVLFLNSIDIMRAFTRGRMTARVTRRAPRA